MSFLIDLHPLFISSLPVFIAMTRALNAWTVYGIASPAGFDPSRSMAGFDPSRFRAAKVIK